MSIHVAIPDTSLSDCSDLREKTIKTGRIGRALAVFRVEHGFVYTTKPNDTAIQQDSALLVRLLRYMETPQYLRRQIFPHSPFLKFAGLLPPLRTRSHPLAAKVSDLSEGDVRWGIRSRDGKIDLGLDRPLSFSESVSDRRPSLFRVIKTTPSIELEITERDEVNEYFGFDVDLEEDLVEHLKSSGMTRIVFSRNGVPFGRLADEIRSTVVGTHSVLAVFGGPSHGVHDMFREQKDLLKENVDFWINAIPDQGTATVRLDEAILVGLGLLNSSLGSIVAKPGFHQ